MKMFTEIKKQHITFGNNAKYSINKYTRQLLVYIPVTKMESIGAMDRVALLGSNKNPAILLIKASKRFGKGFKINKKDSYYTFAVTLTNTHLQLINNYSGRVNEVKCTKRNDGLYINLKEILEQSAL